LVAQGIPVGNIPGTAVTAEEKKDTVVGLIRNINVQSMILALFLLAGSIKETALLAWLPVDFTLLCACLLSALCLDVLLRKQLVPAQLVLVLLLFGCMLLSVLWSPSYGYTVDKITYLFTLTLLAAVAPLLLLRTDDDVRRLYTSLALISCILAFYIVLFYMPKFSQVQRLLVEGTTTIATGRIAGMAMVWLAAVILFLAKRKLPFLVLLLLQTVVLFASGSRGPLLASAISLFLLGLLQGGSIWRRLLKIGALLALLTIVLFVVSDYMPSSSIARIRYLLKGEFRTSENVRLDLYKTGLQLIPVNPQGMGWGTFPSEEEGTVRRYPHNLLIEVFLEGGWMAGFVLTGFIVYAIWRTYMRGGGMVPRSTLAFLVFFLINAMVSGDINDNRIFFAILALALR
jgi:O-antigen ligase